MTAEAPLAPPADEAELMARARALSGLTLAELAERFSRRAPLDLRHAKGFVGALIERALGASAGSRAAPDFEALGVELKTLPVDARGRTLESTFVCTIPLTEIGQVEWLSSRVRRKLSRVLWVPVEGERRIAVAARRIGEPLLWSLPPESETQLRFDWEELAGIIGRGDVETITGHIGRCLQIRPKARDSHARRRGVDVDGARFAALPRGFYLRASFTSEILRQNYAL
ncbi:MAG TPA: DNA mismatch repair endonuclease MutH [Polyangiaceae bacterium]|nr:DNA mismatch repair endonuclease MutH [Polyangiaceae bacterium]